MKVKKSDVWRYFPILSRMAYKGTRFNYAVVKARKMLEAEYHALFEAQKPPPEIVELQDKFRAKHEELKREGLSEEELGKRLDAYLQELNEEYKDAVEAYNKQLKEFSNLLTETLEVDLPKLNFEDLPPDLSNEEMEALITLGILE